MFIQTQFSIFMVNKPGVLAKMLSEMARAKVNIIAMTMMDSVENGVLRMVAANYAKAKEVLEAVNMAFNESEVLCVNLPNEPGAFAEVVEKLARNHINISYAYVTAGARGGRTTGVLKVADVKKAIKTLQGNTAEHDRPAVKKRARNSQRR